MCEENKLELELELEKKNEILVKCFAVKGPNLKGCRRIVTLLIGVILTTRILYSIKVIVQLVFSTYVFYKASFGCSHGNERLKSRTGWFLRTVGPIHSSLGC